jgi:hypothetical protein
MRLHLLRQFWPVFCVCYADLSGGRGTDDASLCGQKLGARERLYAMLGDIFLWVWHVLRHRSTFGDGYITQHIDSADIFRGWANFCQYFSFSNFLTYGPLIIVWADPPTVVSVRVNQLFSFYSILSDRWPLTFHSHPSYQGINLEALSAPKILYFIDLLVDQSRYLFLAWPFRLITCYFKQLSYFLIFL